MYFNGKFDIVTESGKPLLLPTVMKGECGENRTMLLNRRMMLQYMFRENAYLKMSSLASARDE